MTQKPKTLQEIFRERQLKDIKRAQFFYRVDQVWTAFKRLALLGALGYGTHWGYKNSSTLKSVLSAHSAPVQEVGHNFKAGVGMLKETLSERSDSHRIEDYHRIRKKRIQEYQEMGIDPTIKYAEAGTKEYKNELDFYRKAGVFKD